MRAFCSLLALSPLFCVLPSPAGSEQVKSGDAFPKGIVLHENSPAGNVSLDELLANKKVLIFGVPGAFTPGCSKTHLPGYVNDGERAMQLAQRQIAARTGLTRFAAFALAFCVLQLTS